MHHQSSLAHARPKTQGIVKKALRLKTLARENQQEPSYVSHKISPSQNPPSKGGKEKKSPHSSLLPNRARNRQPPNPLPNLIELLDGIRMPLAAHIPRLAHPLVLLDLARERPEPPADRRVARGLEPGHAGLHAQRGLLVARLEVLQHGAVEGVEGEQVDAEVLRVLVPGVLAEAGWGLGRDGDDGEGEGLRFVWVGGQGVGCLRGEGEGCGHGFEVGEAGAVGGLREGGDVGEVVQVCLEWAAVAGAAGGGAVVDG